MAKNKRTPSQKDELSKGTEPAKKQINKKRTAGSITASAEANEARYQNKDQDPGEREDADTMEADERYMSRLKSSKDDRPSGLWGYKNGDASTE